VAVNEFFWARASPDVVEAYESQPEFYETFSELHPREHLFEEKASSAERSHHDQEAEPPQRRYVDSAERTAAPESGDGRSSQNDSKMLEGTWKVIERTYDGHTSSRRGDEEIRCLIGKEAFTWIPPRGRVELRMSFPENQPGAIDLITTGGRLWEGLETTPLIKELLVETTPSIYELKGDTLRICQAEPGAYRRPTSFEAGEGSGQTLFTLKRVSTAGRKAALGISAALVVVALFFWPTRGLYWRWKRKPTTTSQLLALAEAHGTQGHALG
jgi:uncharacterized protein (TIGR03067 family)